MRPVLGIVAVFGLMAAVSGCAAGPEYMPHPEDILEKGAVRCPAGSEAIFAADCPPEQVPVRVGIPQAASAGPAPEGPDPAGHGVNGFKTPEYIIGPEDVLEISVWKNADLSKLVTVRPDGQITLPLIGDIRASGRTASDLKGEIVKKLKEYKQEPIVSVIVQEINSYNIFVLGEVARPGKYQLKSNTTVLQALSLAGGFTPYASKKKILLMRKDPRTLETTEIRVNYQKILYGEDPERDVLLQPGDTIVVP